MVMFYDIMVTSCLGVGVHIESPHMDHVSGFP